MQLRSDCVLSKGGAAALLRGAHIGAAAATTSFPPATAETLEFRSGKTRYRGPYRLSADPVRVLIVAKVAECVGIAALVHAIGRFATRVACSAEEALKLAGAFLPDIVLLTTDLPDLASYRVAATLRWGSGQGSPRLIAITDDILADDRNRALAAGFERYLTVPVQRAALEEVLRHRHSDRTRLEFEPKMRGSARAAHAAAPRPYTGSHPLMEVTGDRGDKRELQEHERERVRTTTSRREARAAAKMELTDSPSHVPAARSTVSVAQFLRGSKPASTDPY